ncbi:MAG: YciI family protein [Pyrinomonadaceae bacterium]
MANFILLLHEKPSDLSGLSPDEIQSVISEYVEWSQGLAADGKLAGGQKLKDDGGKHLAGTDGDFRVTDGPYAEAKEVIGGFFSINASDYNEAVRISKGCPHLKYGGRIELREVEPTS